MNYQEAGPHCAEYKRTNKWRLGTGVGQMDAAKNTPEGRLETQVDVIVEELVRQIDESIDRETTVDQEVSTSERAYREYVLALYTDSKSLTVTANRLGYETGIMTSPVQIARIVRGQGAQVQRPGRPSKVESVADQIPALLEEGNTNKTIADRLGVSQATVYRAKQLIYQSPVNENS